MPQKLRVTALSAFIAAIALTLIACTTEPDPTSTPQPTATPAPEVLAPTPTVEPTPTPVPPANTPTSTPQPTATSAPPKSTATSTPEPTVTPVPPTSTPSPVPQPTATPTPEPTPEATLAFDPSVTLGNLSNGLTYYIRQNEEPQERAQLSLVIKAGSVHEEENERGLAHFVEHMAFNGTERFEKQEIIEYLESLGTSFGPDLNAYTTFDHTRYFLEIPTDDPETSETAFQILSDWAYSISFDPEEVELERDVIIEEWRLSRGFGARFQENWFNPIFGESLYAERAPIGLLEVIENASRERLVGYYDRWYRPDNMALIAVSDFDAETIEAKIQQHFAPQPEGEAPEDRSTVEAPTIRPTIEVPQHEDPRINVFTDPEAPPTQLILVRKLDPITSHDIDAFRTNAVERLAYSMINARLFERGQTENPPYLQSGGQRGGFVERFDISQFWAVVEQGGIETGFQALLEELQRVRQHGFTSTELEREKSTLLSSIEKAFRERDQRTSTSLADTYADHFLSNSLTIGVEAEWPLYQELLPQITVDEVNDVAASWSLTDNSVLLVLRPEADDIKPDDELAAAVQTQLETAAALQVDAYADTFEDVPLLANIPTPGSITAEEQIESIDAQKWTLSNGITVIAKQTDFRNDEVLFNAFSPGGHSLVTDMDHVSAQYAASLVAGSGVGPHDNIDLDKLLAGKQVSVSPYIDELSEGFEGSASPDDLETLFQLINLYATAPRLDPVFFGTLEGSLRASAETRTNDPDSVFFDAVNNILNQHHFRERRLSLELLDELDIERAGTVYSDRFSDLGDSTFVFVGAFDWDALRTLSETYLASLPTTGRTEQWIDHDVDPPSTLEDHVVRSGIEPRSLTVLVYAGDFEWSSADVLALNAVGEMLNIRVRERVREQLGGAYAINAYANTQLIPDPEYQMVVIFGSDPDRIDELFDEVQAEIDWLRNGGDQELLDTVKELLRSPREEQLRTNGFWINQIRTITQRGGDLDAVNQFEDSLDALTLKDIVAVAQRYLTTDRYVRFVLLPEER